MKTHLLVSLPSLLFALGAIAADTSATVSVPIPGVVQAGTRIDLIKDGFEGTEGPIALPNGDLIFTETRANRVTRIAADGSLSTFLDNSNGSNGLAFNQQGQLIAVQTVKPAVGIVYPADQSKVLTDGAAGKPLNRPNDLVVDRQGGVYFTDPGAAPEPGKPAPAPAVYYYSPKGELSVVATDIERPNGIQLSPDERTLYVANTWGEYVLAYDIGKDGKAGKRRNFARLAGYKKTDTGYSSGADGLAVDGKGRLYVASNTGIQVFDAKGQPLGNIELPKQPQNLAFAGPDKKTLYVVGRGAAYRLAVLTQGYQGRAK